MALNKSILGSLMRDKVHAVGVVGDGGEIAYFQALAEAVIEHFIAAAVIQSSVAVVSVAGVTTGPGVSGPGAGTAVGKIS